MAAITSSGNNTINQCIHKGGRITIINFVSESAYDFVSDLGT